MPKKPPFGRFTVASFLDYYLARSPKTQREIAKAVGFEKPNMITMIKQGLTKLPIERVPAMAQALEVDERFLMNLVLAEYHPALYTIVQETYGLMVTRNEESIIKFIRAVSGRGDPWLAPDVRDGLIETFGPYAAEGKLPSPP